MRKLALVLFSRYQPNLSDEGSSKRRIVYRYVRGTSDASKTLSAPNLSTLTLGKNPDNGAYVELICSFYICAELLTVLHTSIISCQKQRFSINKSKKTRLKYNHADKNRMGLKIVHGSRIRRDESNQNRALTSAMGFSPFFSCTLKDITERFFFSFLRDVSPMYSQKEEEKNGRHWHETMSQFRRQNPWPSSLIFRPPPPSSAFKLWWMRCLRFHSISTGRPDQH